MTTTTQAQAYETSHAIALQIAVAALEQSNATLESDPITAHQFRTILVTARRIVARMSTLLKDQERGGEEA